MRGDQSYFSTASEPTDQVQHVEYLCTQSSMNLSLSRLTEDCDWCGAVQEFVLKGDVLAWTSRTGDEGAFEYGLNAAILPKDYRQTILPRALVTPSSAELSQVSIAGDAIYYTDDASGSARIRKASVRRLDWVGIGAADLHLKENVKAGDEYMMYFSNSDTPSLYWSSTQVDMTNIGWVYQN